MSNFKVTDKIFRVITCIIIVITALAVIGFAYVFVLIDQSSLSVSSINKSDYQIFDQELPGTFPNGLIIDNVKMKMDFPDGATIDLYIEIPSYSYDNYIKSIIIAPKSVKKNKDYVVVHLNFSTENDNIVNYMNTHGRSNKWIINSAFILIILIIVTVFFSIFVLKRKKHQ